MRQIHIVQIVTGVRVIIEKFLPEVGKMLPRGRRPTETFHELKAKMFNDDQWR